MRSIFTSFSISILQTKSFASFLSNDSTCQGSRQDPFTLCLTNVMSDFHDQFAECASDLSVYTDCVGDAVDMRNAGLQECNITVVQCRNKYDSDYQMEQLYCL